MPVFGSLTNRRSVGPSCKSKPGPRCRPSGLPGRAPCWSSRLCPSRRHTTSRRTCSTIRAAFKACELRHVDPSHLEGVDVGKAQRLHRERVEDPSSSREAGLRSVHAGAILGGPLLKSGTVACCSVSPTPNVMLPLEFRKNPFHTQPAVPTGPPNTNSNPPSRIHPKAACLIRHHRRRGTACSDRRRLPSDGQDRGTRI